MAEYTSDHVKNIVLLGHSGSGKTTMAEAMLFDAGITHRRGSVEEKNTVADYTELEQERGNSIFSKLLHAPWRGYKINILDTPGYDDFVGEVISALRVADTGIILLNASMGVEVGTEVIWEYTEQFKTPSLFVVNKLDHPKADFEKTLADAKANFGSHLVLVQYPINPGPGFSAIIDVLNLVMYEYHEGQAKPDKKPIPDSERERAEALHKELIEAIAGNDEGLMEKYFEQGSLSEDDMREGLRLSMIRHELFPIFCASALQLRGVARIMSYIDNVCPAATEMPPQQTVECETLACAASGPTCVFVYKTVSEPHVGELSFFKVYSGSLKPGVELVNENTGVSEKLTQLFAVEGNKRTPVEELVAGDIGATIKLKNTHANNTLHEKGRPLELKPIVFPEPLMNVSISNKKKGEEEKLASALHHLHEEDPTIRLEVSQELGQTLLHCMGDMHLAVVKWKLEHLYHLDVEYGKPRIAYRETIRKKADATYRHKKQSGGAGQFGEVSLRIEPWFEGMPDPQGLNVRGRDEYPLPWGGKLVYYNCIVGGVIDQRFLPSIMKGVMEKMQRGPLTGSFVRDVRVSVYDGKMHPVDSNDMAFKTAGMMAFREAFQQADPQLLEPIFQLEVLAPDELTGNIMGDLQGRRAIVEGFDAEGHFTVIKAQVPHAEMFGYASVLRSLSQGRARFRMKFDHYAPVQADIQKKLSESYHKETAEAE
ncbi:MAG: elongation factor G [Bacteroidetes bacterium]|nr:elongation factor G [Bacteroidota bacterium]MBS1630214.1 elongation factor G [Bacteroidota bacterium]